MFVIKRKAVGRQSNFANKWSFLYRSLSKYKVPIQTLNNMKVGTILLDNKTFMGRLVAEQYCKFFSRTSYFV